MILFLRILAVSDAIRTSLGPRGMDKMVKITKNIVITQL